MSDWEADIRSVSNSWSSTRKPAAELSRATASYSRRQFTGHKNDGVYVPLNNAIGSVWEQLKTIDKMNDELGGDLSRLVILHDMECWKGHGWSRRSTDLGSLRSGDRKTALRRLAFAFGSGFWCGRVGPLRDNLSESQRPALSAPAAWQTRIDHQLVRGEADGPSASQDGRNHVSGRKLSRRSRVS